MMKTQTLLGEAHDTDYTIDFDKGQTCFVRGVDDRRSEQSCEGDFTGPTWPEVDIATSLRRDAPNDETLLMICDSFCGAHQPLFQASFATVHVVHWKELRGQNLANFLAEVGADFVDFQLVERALLEVRFNI